MPVSKTKRLMSYTRSAQGLVKLIWKDEKAPVRVLARKTLKAIGYLATGNFARFSEKFRILTSEAAAPHNKEFSIGRGQCFTVLCTKHTEFIAHLAQRELQRAGYSASIAKEYRPKFNDKRIYLVICAQMFKRLPKKFVAFQMEQTVHPRWFNDSYLAILNRAKLILDYSVRNIEFLQSKGMPFQKQYFVPIGPFPDYVDFLRTNGYSLPQQPKSIGVLFYGDPTSPRRREFLEKIQAKHSVFIASEIFGQDLINIILSAKIVINIHYYERALLETTRIHEALSCGTPVLSEASADMEAHSHLQDIVHFTPIGDSSAMLDAIDKLLSDSNLYARVLTATKEYAETNTTFSTYFQRFLLAQSFISLNDYMHRRSLDIDLSVPIPRLCLSLSETPERRRSFQSRPTHGFKLFEGLRYPKGWIGCATSYKHIMKTLLNFQKEICVVCEDDAILPANLEEKLQSILEFLLSNKHPWDLFSGMIAHLHPEAHVLKIEKHAEIEYIFIDKMTSMVFNIYSKNAMQIVSQWDESNQDMKTNAIDRYIENYPNFVTVTTLPFLVGYAEESSSTLWNIDNSDYKARIRESEILLAQKVAEYKRNNAVQVRAP